MNEESKNAALSLAEKLNLKLRAVAQRALPEIYDLERDAKSVFRGVSDTERLNLALEYVFLDDRQKWLLAEKERLRKKYRELDRDIELELSDCADEKERLLAGIRYSLIREAVKDEKPSAPTNVLPPSKDLAASRPENK